MNKWRRVSPIGLLYFFFSNIMLLLNNIIYLIPVLFTSYEKLLENPWLLLFGTLGIITLFGCGAFLQYYFFRYRLGAQSIEIKTGVLFKKHLNLPFTRIQNVKLITPLYFRPFGYTSVELDTAGSAKNEAKIVALNIEVANRLKREILSQNHPQDQAIEKNDSASGDTQRDINNEQVLNRRSIIDLIVHGITNNRVWIIIAILAPMTEKIIDYLSGFALSLGIDFSELFSPQTHAWWQLTAYALLLLIVSYAIVMLLSVFGSIIAFYGYTLSKHGQTYIRRSGLLTHHEVVMKLPRLQLVIRQQDWLDVLIGRINLRFEQINTTVKQQPGMEIRNKIMVPSINLGQFNDLIDDVWPDNQLAATEFSRISKRFIFKNIMLLALPLHLIIATAMIFNDQWPYLTLVVASMILVSLLIFMRWYRWGYAIDNEFVYIRKGVLGVDYYTFPIHKVQQTKFKQSWFMQRHHLSSVILVIASGAQKLPFIKAADGREMINQCLHRVESSKRNWM